MKKRLYYLDFLLDFLKILLDFSQIIVYNTFVLNRNGLRAFSSVGQSSRLITGRSWVRVPEGPPYRGIAQLVERRSPKP